MSLITEPPVSYLTGRYQGLPGGITRYFWLQAIYPSGRSVLSNLVTITNAGSLSSANLISLQWAVAPGAIGYDLIETPSATEPTVNSTATIAVAIGLTGNSFNLNYEPTLASWTYYQGNGSTVGSVTSVSVVTANGVSGSVATPTTTPAITLALGAITPSSVVSTGAVSGTSLSTAGKVTGISIVVVPVLIANLPATPVAGQRAAVSDSNATYTAGIGAVVATGGAFVVPVFFDGTNWLIG